MALHPNFPKSPYEILDPSIRWFPADEALREQGAEKLLPPLVSTLRKKVKEWRENNYEGATVTSKALLLWWFETEHFTPKADGTMFNFKYYFAQREAVETVIYLYDVAKARDKYDLLRFDSSGAVSAGMFTEDWSRYVIKMATGSGKTKVLSLILAWSYFHKLYEPDSELARNFLLVTPNIIVLDRILSDFNGLKIFFQDPVLPENGYDGQNWRDDFQLTVHIQDEIQTVNKTGNIFITNIHRVFDTHEKSPSINDEDTTSYFLGPKPVGATNESKVDLGNIVRDIDELVVLNDEAHHIHDERMAWFKSIEDIHNRLKQKGGRLALQVDVTATPKHNNGAIFVQTISDYPLVEAIYQNVVKHPVIPDNASRAKLVEQQSIKFSERYREYLDLGYIEWKKVYEEHSKIGKKPILFIMTDDTRNCDEVAEYMRNTYPDFKDSVLVIHTKENGDISESSTGKSKEELIKLREDANTIDETDNGFKAIVSVLMLKEGWDVKNVTTIVGLRAFNAPSNILPEQTLGRGLRKMYREEGLEEYVSVVGTDAFMDFVDSIRSEGVELEHKKMGEGTAPKAPIVIEVDKENLKKDIEKLDIVIPVLTPRIQREYKNFSELDVASLSHQKISYKVFSEEEKREIIFTHVVRQNDSEEVIHHKTLLDTDVIPNYQSVIGFFAEAIRKDLRLVGGHDILYGKIKEFVQNYLFDREVDLNDLNTLRNLSEVEVTRTIFETFKKAINDLTVVDKGEAEIKEYIDVGKSRPFVVKDQGYLVPKKSIFNKIIGDSRFELQFANFLEECDDIISYVKNYLGVHFRIDYKDADGNIRDYYPDFIIKVSEDEYYIVETKGREDLDDLLKISRLKQWCVDINLVQSKAKYKPLYIKQEEFENYHHNKFKDLVSISG